jgi:alpha-methylacyl-CoA racemase
MLLALGITAALLSAKQTGRGQVVDAAMTDGTAVQLALIHGMLQVGLWREGRESNMFDGGAPFYRTYRTADGGHVAVGCVEPQVYAAMLTVLGLADDPLLAAQHDRAAWPDMSSRLAAVFATRTRDEWTAAFDGTDACVTPVLGFAEAAAHPHNAERGTYLRLPDGRVGPGTAPRFSGTPSAVPRPAATIGAHTDEVLAELGVDEPRRAALRTAGVVGGA